LPDPGDGARVRTPCEFADAWLQAHEPDDATLDRYRELAALTIGLALCDIPISKLRTRALEQFYAQL
jgi:hypothetical protein